MAAAFAILIPAITFLAGAAALERLSGRAELSDDQKCRIGMSFGYTPERVSDCWKNFQPTARDAQVNFLILDLVFPYFYAAGFAVAGLLLWNASGRSVAVAWLIVPLILLVAADNIENLLLLRVYAELRDGTVNDSLVRIASGVTITKVSLFVGASLAVIGWAVKMLVKPFFPG
jgi:hypothetical protein